jgi:hypothetical protein
LNAGDNGQDFSSQVQACLHVGGMTLLAFVGIRLISRAVRALLRPGNGNKPSTTQQQQGTAAPAKVSTLVCDLFQALAVTSSCLISISSTAHSNTSLSAYSRAMRTAGVWWMLLHLLSLRTTRRWHVLICPTVCTLVVMVMFGGVVLVVVTGQ